MRFCRTTGIQEKPRRVGAALRRRKGEVGILVWASRAVRLGRGFGVILCRRLLYRRGCTLVAESSRNGACHGHA